MLHSIQDVVNSYGQFLEVKYPTLHKKYQQRLEAQPEAARAEALACAFLRGDGYKVTVSEDVATGGVDFLCVGRQGQMLIEIACLLTETVSQHSSWPKETPEGAFGFRRITDVVRGCVSGKTAQLANQPIPRVLMIVSEHPGASVLLGPNGAEAAMTSNTKLSFPVNVPNPEVSVITNLEESVFFRFAKDRRVEPCRKSISAVLLVAADPEKLLVVGLLHPAPAIAFNIALLPRVPFLRTSNWPFAEGRIETEWIMGQPKAHQSFHWSITLTDQELKNLGDSVSGTKGTGTFGTSA